MRYNGVSAEELRAHEGRIVEFRSQFENGVPYPRPSANPSRAVIKDTRVLHYFRWQNDDPLKLAIGVYEVPPSQITELTEVPQDSISKLEQEIKAAITNNKVSINISLPVTFAGLLPCDK